MKKRLIISLIILLFSTLCGWTQQLPHWEINKDGKDTIINYKFTKESIKNFRIYVVGLEKYKSLYELSEVRRLTSDETIKSLLEEKDNLLIINNLLESENSDLIKLSTDQEKVILKDKKKIKLIPYIGGGSFIGGILLCMILI